MAIKIVQALNYPEIEMEGGGDRNFLAVFLPSQFSSILVITKTYTQN